MTAAQAPSAHSELFYIGAETADGKAGTVNDGDVQIRKLIREFEADAVYAQRHLCDSIRKNGNFIVPEEEQATLPARPRATLDRYALTDTLAIYYRDRTRSTFIGLLAIAFLAMLVLEFFAHVLHEFFPIGKWPRLIFWFCPLLWLTAWTLWYYAHHRQYQKKYHDYRALAEGLRVQLFWNLLRLPDAVEEYYLRKQQGELEWIRRALRYWRERDEKAIPDPEFADGLLMAWKDIVRRRWVRGQGEYFAKVAGPREKRNGERCRTLAAILFWTSLGLSVILGACEVWGAVQAPSQPHEGLPLAESLLVFGVGMLLIGSAIAVAYGEKLAFAEHARQYQGTSMLFREADANLSDGPLTTAEVEVLRNLGKEALQENGDWLLLHRDRPLEVIVP